VPSILTQEEVDALLAAVASGEVTAVLGGEESVPRRVELFEFDHPRGGESLQGMDLVHDMFAESASASLSGLLSLPVVMARTVVTRVRMSDYAPSLPQPSMIYQVRLGTDGSEMLIQLGAGTILAMVERLFGGPVISPVTERPLTGIEKSVLRRVVQKLLGDLSRSWARFRRLEPEIVAAESQPSLLRFGSPTDPITLVTFEVRLAETVGLLTFAYPEPFIRSVFGTGEEAEAGTPPAAGTASTASPADLLAARLRRATVPVTILLGRARLKIGELAGLKVGDVVQLETPAGGTLTASVNGRPKFLVRPGLRGGRFAVTVVGPSVPGDDS
jgi:flagellar motor switch protein FliM